jgi:hypothetical protein
VGNTISALTVFFFAVAVTLNINKWYTFKNLMRM